MVQGQPKSHFRWPPIALEFLNDSCGSCVQIPRNCERTVLFDMETYGNLLGPYDRDSLLLQRRQEFCISGAWHSLRAL